MYREEGHSHKVFERLGPSPGPWAWWCFIRHQPLGTLSVLLLCGCIAIACLAPLLAPYDPYQFNLNTRGFPIRRQAPNATFLFGTDTHGRDVLSRMMYGTRYAFLVGVCAVAIGTVLGTLVGLASGYWEGTLDQGLQRLVDMFMALPDIVLALVVLSVYGQSLPKVIVVIGLVVIAPGVSRVARSAMLASKRRLYIDAALAAGASSWRILRRHLLPQVSTAILVLMAVWLGRAMVTEAALSFLGFGTPPPTPTWGGMLSGEGRRHLTTAPYLALFPGLILSLVIVALHTFGNAVQNFLASRLRL